MSTWYADVALQGNQSVILETDTRLIWNGATVPLPPYGAGTQNLLYVRIHPNGTKFAGVGHHDDLCWEWNGTSWVNTGRTAVGPQSVIYDRGGILHVNSVDSSGYRYADGSNHIWTCDETRADVDAGVWDYSDHGDLCIGQGGDALGFGDDPIIALYQGRRILLQVGRCRFINSYRNGDLVAYACWRADTNQALTRFLTISEIIASPDVGSPPPPGSHPVGTVKTRNVPDEKLPKQPQFADLKITLAQSKQTDNALYQTVAVLIDRLTQFQNTTVATVNQVGNKVQSGTASAANNSATYLTTGNESQSLTNSKQLLAGTGIVFDDSIMGVRVIHSTATDGNGNGDLGNHYDTPLTDGNPDETDLIFAAGECIIVQVPV